MLQVRAEPKGQNMYIESIKQKFQEKAQKLYIKKLLTSPSEKRTLNATSQLNNKNTIKNNLRLLDLGFDIGWRRNQLKWSISQQRHQKKWSQIQDSEYEQIKNKGLINKIKIPSTKANCRKSLFDILIPSNDLESSKVVIKKQLKMGLIVQNGGSCEMKLKIQGNQIERIKHKKPKPSISYGQGSSTKKQQFNFSIKFPRVSKEHSFVKMESIESIDREQEIFCNRGIKKSQIKLGVYRLKNRALEADRRRIRTIDYSNIYEPSPITPWNNTNGATKSLFY